jgi:hypothetical protein
MQPLRVSTNWTLFLKIFLPTFWIVFFGSLTFFVVVLNGGGALSSHFLLKAVTLFTFILFLLALYFSLIQLKRVEVAEDHFYVTNYFKTYRYSYDSIKSINETDLFITKLVSIRFVQKSSFGRKVRFLSRAQVWDEFTREHATLFSHLLHE